MTLINCTEITEAITLSFDSLSRNASMKEVPHFPGVYVMYNDSEVLYVGKAKDLYKRIIGYTKSNISDQRIRYIVDGTNILKLHIVKDERDALFLEHLLIRQLNPIHNIKHRHLFAYPYFCLTKHAFPRIVRYEGQASLYKYGPFESYTAMENQIGDIQKAFLLRSCTDFVFRGRKEPCMMYHMKRCSAPCVNKISQEEYAVNIQELNRFVALYRKDVEARCFDAMKECSDRLEFEKAAMYRDRLRLLDNIISMNLVYLARIKDIDIVVHYQESIMSVSRFRDGEYKSNDLFFSNIEQNITKFYEETPPSNMIITNYPPLLLLVPKYARIPKRGDKRVLLLSAYQNLVNVFKYFSVRELRRTAVKQELLNVLNRYSSIKLSEVRSIEAFDNSHAHGCNAVCGIITQQVSTGEHSFIAIDIGESQDDYYMMRCAMLSRLDMEQPLPDLFLIDGGIGQVQAIAKVLQSVNLDIPILGIVKSPDRIVDINNKIVQTSKELLLLFQAMRDKVHGYTRSRHRRDRDKAFLK